MAELNAMLVESIVNLAKQSKNFKDISVGIGTFHINVNVPTEVEITSLRITIAFDLTEFLPQVE